MNRYSENMKLYHQINFFYLFMFYFMLPLTSLSSHQLIGVRAQLTELLKKCDNPDTPGRMRFLKGNDPSQSELWITLGKLERRMAAKEQDMAEKNLTYEAICRLVDSLQVKADAGM